MFMLPTPPGFLNPSYFDMMLTAACALEHIVQNICSTEANLLIEKLQLKHAISWLLALPPCWLWGYYVIFPPKFLELQLRQLSTGNTCIRRAGAEGYGEPSK
jgi:hypothetical protein